ncbi:putative alginate O-acetylase AlgI [Sphingomonas antarctica]|uniref:MBOAT family O-acyltransferase n=1 Tax=Sphingomonas antarctica TaxID=2040274 RepID=UPI0039EABD8C
MSFTSLLFMGFVALAALVTQPLRGTWRLAAILVAAAIFVASYVTEPLIVVPLLLFVLTGYLCVLFAASRKARHGVAIAVTLIVALFIWFKRYPFVAFIPTIPFPYMVLGASYLLFRILHLILEVGGGALKAPSFGRFLAYLFFFPSFLSGPINRYEPFERDLLQPAAMDSEAAYATLYRLLYGFIKVAVVGELLKILQDMASARLDAVIADGGSVTTIAILYSAAAPLYLLFLYANFSGYTDMAIAIGRLFGISLPENFNKPFRAANFQDLWSRWHITLSEWFKIYVFNPLMKMLIRRFPSRNVGPYLGVIALFVVFLILGAWHGASWEFMLCGLLFATGVSVNKLFQIEMAKRMGKKPYQALAKKRVYIWAARGFTLSYYSICLMTFWRSVGQMGVLAVRLSVPGTLLATAMMGVVFVLVLWPVEAAGDWLTSRSTAVEHRRGSAKRIALLGGMIVLLALAVPMINSSTDFVYKAF